MSFWNIFAVSAENTYILGEFRGMPRKNLKYFTFISIDYSSTVAGVPESSKVIF